MNYIILSFLYNELYNFSTRGQKLQLATSVTNTNGIMGDEKREGKGVRNR